MSAVALGDAFLALAPAKKFDGQVVNADGTVPTPPWTYWTLTLPDVTERSLARPGQLVTVRARGLVYAGTAKGVRIVADQVMAAVEGARPVAEGWRCSPVELVNTREAVEDRDVKVTATNLHPLYGVLEFLFTASPTA